MRPETRRVRMAHVRIYPYAWTNVDSLFFTDYLVHSPEIFKKILPFVVDSFKCHRMSSVKKDFTKNLLILLCT